jgi:UDP-N-acetylglucosamine 2-epimerase (non-hydrolysing)
VDDSERLVRLLEALAVIAVRLPVVFPVHPRTRKAIDAAGLSARLAGERLLAIEPTSYLATVGLMREARVVVTDSGGIQEETTALGIPCLTIRQSTERPITVDEGTNTLVAGPPEELVGHVDEILANGGKTGRIPPLWDGEAAGRIAEHIAAFLKMRA